MKKTAILFIFLGFISTAVFASDDDLFFFDDGIEIQNDVSAKDNLSKGILFEDGSVKVGGNLDASITTQTTIYDNLEKSFSDNLANSILTPTLNATLFVDARPSQVLRIYTKFGFEYPFNSSLTKLGTEYTFSDYFKLKELFTDFSIGDTAFFRFGIHVVKWGTGYFYSPVSDLINASSINPEDVEAQLDGCLNLRTQIIFPDSQNCLWFYLVPDTNPVSLFTTSSTALKYTSLAAKYEFVVNTWEFGFGGIYKYQHAPKAMITASGNLGKINVFGEFLYSYGSDKEWLENTSWNDKTSIFKATVGCSYYWKDPSITFAAQYYYDGNNFSIPAIPETNDYAFIKDYLTQGHNFAVLANFGRIFGSTDFTATVLALANFGKKSLPEVAKIYLHGFGLDDYIKTFTFSGMFYYSPINELKLGIGPYINFNNNFTDPNVTIKFTATLGGGKF